MIASTMPAPPPAKTCACGCTYSPDEWLELPLVGRMVDDEFELELRNCPLPCGSTLAIERSVSL